MPKIPFGWLPGHVGLKGKTREIAKAEYELEGYDLEKKLLDIKRDEFDSDVLKKKYWDIELKYNNITSNQYYRWLTELIEDDTQRELSMLELDKREGKIGDLEYSKKCATLKKEPWVTVLNMDFSNKTSLEGSFELDWNEPFVDKLKAEGYIGPTDDSIVNQWFITVCRNVALEEFDGLGDFNADADANLEAVKRWNSEQMLPGKRIHK